MSENERLVALSGILDRNGRWIEVADTKANIFLVLATALAGITSAPAVDGTCAALALVRAGGAWRLASASFYFLVLIALVTALALGLWHAFSTIRARTVRNQRRGFIFFGDVVKSSPQNLEKRLLSQDAAEFNRQVAEQIYATADIADQKYQHLGRCTWWVGWSILFAFIVYVLSMAIE